MMFKNKPKVGDLVRLKETSYDDWPDHVARPTGHGLSGIVMDCIGIRCHVLWTNGKDSKPERQYLEVIS